MRELAPRPEEPLRVGDIIAETPLGTKVPVTLFPTVGINRPGTNRWPVLIQELDEIAYWVRTQAVPRLITDSEPSEPAFPTRYEISVGHEDERRAICAGSTTTAGERYTQRLTAASARPDLVDIISQIDGSPSCQQIAAWLDHLSDEEVLERLNRLQVTFNYNPGLMLHNIEVMNGLRDEALAFGREAQPAVER
ncbi:hypothetical protein [Arthrobacter sp. 24S4-2]|uniref:hypothetical protein n=1 Tax=Arthrobacter sp. 24S4-2 TaxID=2575374 RepID=UPI001C2FC1A5|nr:hypothetical protein [Arthrobacter sp. 24S4-2]